MGREGMGGAERQVTPCVAAGRNWLELQARQRLFEGAEFHTSSEQHQEVGSSGGVIACALLAEPALQRGVVAQHTSEGQGLLQLWPACFVHVLFQLRKNLFRHVKCHPSSCNFAQPSNGGATYIRDPQPKVPQHVSS